VIIFDVLKMPKASSGWISRPWAQSYGMAVKYGMKDMAPSPGEACNGHDGWLVNPPPEEH
jgi:hypothetical protein